jgi:hypothetical protein
MLSVTKPQATPDPIQTEQKVAVAQRYKNRNELTYLFDDTRIRHDLARNKPLKAIESQRKLLRNHDYFKSEYNDEIQRIVDRSAWWE